MVYTQDTPALDWSSLTRLRVVAERFERVGDGAGAVERDVAGGVVRARGQERGRPGVGHGAVPVATGLVRVLYAPM